MAHLFQHGAKVSGAGDSSANGCYYRFGKTMNARPCFRNLESGYYLNYCGGWGIRKAERDSTVYMVAGMSETPPAEGWIRFWDDSPLPVPSVCFMKHGKRGR